MTEAERIALSASRLEKASQMLDSAKLLLEHNDFASASSRSGYLLARNLGKYLLRFLTISM